MKSLFHFLYLPPMPRPAPMSKSIEEKASAFLLLAVGLEAAGGMRAGDGDDEEVDNAAAIDGDKTLFGGAPMPCVVAVAAASVAVAELLLFIGAPVAPPPRRDDDEPPPGERDRPARPASGSPAGAIDFSSSSSASFTFFCDEFLFIFFSVFFFLHSDRLCSSCSSSCSTALPARHVPVVDPRDADLRRRDAVPHEIQVLAVGFDISFRGGLVRLEERLRLGQRVFHRDAGAEPQRDAAVAEPAPVDAGAGVDLLRDAEVEVDVLGGGSGGVGAFLPLRCCSLLVAFFAAEALPQRDDGGPRARDLRELGQEPGPLGLQGGLDAAVGGVGGVELADGVVGGAACRRRGKEVE